MGLLQGEIAKVVTTVMQIKICCGVKLALIASHEKLEVDVNKCLDCYYLQEIFKLKMISVMFRQKYGTTIAKVGPYQL